MFVAQLACVKLAVYTFTHLIFNLQAYQVIHFFQLPFAQSSVSIIHHNFFSLHEAEILDRDKKEGRKSFANTSEITEVLVGMNVVPVDSNTELCGNKASAASCTYLHPSLLDTLA